MTYRRIVLQRDRPADEHYRAPRRRRLSHSHSPSRTITYHASCTNPRGFIHQTANKVPPNTVYYYCPVLCTTLFLFLFLLFLWCPYTAINVSVQYNGGLLPDIILLTQCYYHRETRLPKCHEEVLSSQPMIPPKRFDIFPSDWGMLRRSMGAFRFLFKNKTKTTKRKEQ